MSFRDRMLTETGTPMPRYLYLLLKPVETIAVGVLVSRLTGLGLVAGAVIAVVAYVGLGLFLWYRHRAVTASLAPGAFLGDALYHFTCSAPALVLWLPIPLWARWLTIAAVLYTWWLLDTAEYGPMRNPTEG